MNVLGYLPICLITAYVGYNVPIANLQITTNKGKLYRLQYRLSCMVPPVPDTSFCDKLTEVYNNDSSCLTPLNRDETVQVIDEIFKTIKAIQNESVVIDNAKRKTSQAADRIHHSIFRYLYVPAYHRKVQKLLDTEAIVEQRMNVVRVRNDYLVYHLDRIEMRSWDHGRWRDTKKDSI